MQVIYIDTLFIINLIVNYLIMLATAKISARPASRLRIALGATVGAVYAVLTVLPNMGFLDNAIMMVVFALIMVLIVFGGEQGLIRIGVIFFSISAAFGGAVLAVSIITGENASRISVSVKVLLISFFICYGILSMVFARLGKREVAGGLVKITVAKRGKSADVTALVDTGNSLYDPMTGGGVIVDGLEPLLPLFTDDVKKVLKGNYDSMELLERLAPYGEGYGFFLVPYTAVGVGSSFLIGFRPDEVKIGGKVKKKMSVAISPTCISDGGVYSALVNGGA